MRLKEDYSNKNYNKHHLTTVKGWV
ncbi:hypothetical protein Patl1_14898 [Pistacia atlantica]|uniref:Uncharacterized protein n=1 Tax=Pistacia atlantica TaxID=434234 RepID=A0ACC1ASF5_9ROSI|nr:hypothetical protein Patl1_14898 [Pistacia atlantica]